MMKLLRSGIVTNGYLAISFITIIAFTGSMGLLNGQSHPYEVRYSYEIEQQLADESITATRAAILYSLIGDYRASIEYSDIPVSWGVDSLDLTAYEIQQAKDHILEMAKDHQIVIISENHNRPQHRVFAKSLLAGLSEQGFGHIGLETFGRIPETTDLLDQKLEKRGYPLDSPLTGTYTMEPQMGQLVRSALALDYKCFAYERAGRKTKKDRDEIQADNIIKYIQANPDSKIVIMCGFHHAIESAKAKRGSSRWMAHLIKTKIGVDPLTIYQDNFTEKVIEDEHPILASVQIIEPSVFVDKSGKVVRLSEHVDVEVIHPKTLYIQGRPAWLFDQGKAKATKVKHRDYEIDYPVIVAAYLANETNSVSVDRIELKHKYDNKSFVLPIGKYRVVMTSGDQKIEYLEEVE